MPTKEEIKAKAELELKEKQEAIRLGLTPQQTAFLKYVKEIRAKGYTDVSTLGFTTVTSTEEKNQFVVNPTDLNGVLYNLVTLAINTDDAEADIILPTISQIIAQNIFPTIDLNLGFQVKIFNNGSNGNKVGVNAGFEDKIGSELRFEISDNSSLILTPVFTDNWSVQITE